MNNSENYKLFRKHRVEIFNMIWDIWDRAPSSKYSNLLFFPVNKEQMEKEMAEYLKAEEPKIREKLLELGFSLQET
jgi:hypothetical protein